MILAVPLLRLLPGEPPSRRGLQKSTYAMGTTVSVSVEDESNPNVLDAAVGEAFGEISRLEGLLTRFKPTSELSRLNLGGELDGPAEETVTVMGRSLKFSEETEGAFDVTVKPALDLFSRFLGGGPAPSDADFEAVQKLIDYERVALTPHSVTFASPGMGATLDGIAAGFVLDQAAASLRSSGVTSALVQAGGTIIAIGSRSDGSPWKIGVRDPLNENGIVGTLQLRDQAVATTGDYENYFTPDRRFYHVVDPSTARSPLYSHSATVVAPTAMEADPLGVVLMVKSPSEGMRTIEGKKDTECLLCTRENGLLASPGLGLV